MKRFAWIAFGVLVIGGVAVTLPSCGKNLQCGAGTVEMNGECVGGGAAVVACPDGGVVIGGQCYPIICGANTRFDPATHTCIGNGNTQTMGCATSCSAPGTSTFCVTGTAKSFINGMIVGPTATSHAKVRVYDPIAFATNPNTPPAATVPIEDMGCYIADGVPRFSSGLVAVAVDDDDMPGPLGMYATLGRATTIHANQNVTGLVALMLLNTEAQSWQDQINALGGTQPPGCTMGMVGCGAWIGAYYNAQTETNPVTNVRPTRPGDDPPNSNVFCFAASGLATIDPNAKTTTSTGMCIISPDVVEMHAGACGTGGCMCGNMPCSPVFPANTGGTAPGVFFYEPFFAM